MGGLTEGGERHAHFRCASFVRFVGMFAREERLEMVEVCGFPFVRKLFLQSADDEFQQPYGPGAVEDFLRREFVRWLEAKFRFAVFDVQRQDFAVAATLLRVRLIPLVGEKVLHGNEQERAEPPAGRRGLFEGVLLDEPREEALRDVFGTFGIDAFFPQENVKWVPIPLAQERQCVARVGTVRFTRAEDDAPVRRSEIAAWHPGIVRESYMRQRGA